MKSGDMVHVKGLRLFYPEPAESIGCGPASAVNVDDLLLFLGEVYDHPKWHQFYSKVLFGDLVGWIRSDGLEVVE